MIFTLVSYSIEWLNTKLEEDKFKIEQEIEQKKKEEEEFERVFKLFMSLYRQFSFVLNKRLFSL